ncbi:Diaminopimelate epimerase-like protein [Epithele typhae]|uniref:Diaminopimelate epimerase-like protein n=1 Tax=Epithele typhae TaxID=378194 RepID=UPI002008894F|nr:Diaminopimelate epimerase-like protein [Epithele typhae]KAH9929548.1 Diaminopimelate epimerase-like protein [Epithele typhae]
MDIFQEIISGNISQDSIIRTVDMHTGGEPTRIIVGGYPPLGGSTLLEKRTYARKELDHIRKRLMREPRGHKEMYGAILVQETERTRAGEADIGVLFCHNEGYSTMCGHATIALGRFLVDTADTSVFPNRKQVPFDEAEGKCTVRLHAPCGVVEITVPSIRDGDRVRSNPDREVRFMSVRSFAAAIDAVVDIPNELRWMELVKAGRHTVKFDLAYGGAFYAIVQEKALGFERLRDGEVDMKRLDEATAALKKVVAGKRELFEGHGLEAELRYLYGVIVVDEGEGERGLGGLDAGRLGVCFFADQQIDRSPTGSGVSARVALARAKGLLAEGERVRFDSPLSARRGGEAGAFIGGWAGADRVRVEGRAFYTGACAFVVEDGFAREGFVL